MEPENVVKRRHKATSPQKHSKRIKRSTTDLDVDEKPVNPSEIEASDPVATESQLAVLGHDTFLESHGTGSYMGPSHAEDPYLVRFMDKRNDKGLIPFVTRSIRPVNDDVAFAVYQKECECSNATRSVWDNRYDHLEKTVAPYKEQLIALFFRFIDWTYPAVDKKRFYRSYFHHDPPMHRGLMCSMLGLGCTYWKYSTNLCTKAIPARLVDDLWRMSLYYIEHDINCKGASLDTVTALLLYLQKRMAGDGIHEQVTSRIHVGMLISLSFSLGLHLDCSSWDISPVEKVARNRAWALVYYSEKWSAANLGHPSMLARDDSKHKFDSQYPQERWFVYLVKVTNILSEVLDRLYSPRSPTHPADVAVICKRLLWELRNWWESLPEDIANIRAKNDLRYCSNGMVHLSALAVEVLLFRKLLSPAFGGKHRNEARDLVQRIITFCLEITHPHLHAFWLAPCRLNLSSLAHFVLRYHAQSPDNERKQNTALMRSWMECLRSLSHGWEEGVGLAYHRMDALFYRGQTTMKLPIIDETYEASDEEDEEDNANRAGIGGVEPLGLEDDMGSASGDSPANVLFAGDNLHDLLYDLIWE